MLQAVVLGLGVSGKGVVRLLLSQGYRVYGVDESLSVSKRQELDPLIKEGMELFSCLETISLKECAFAVVSPGISPKSPLYCELQREGIEIVGEAEFCFRSIGKTQSVIGITGTNGKTTVTLLTEHILNSSGKKARALGNVGASLGEYFCHPDPQEIVVAELSSFQLETLTQKVFDAGIVLNLSLDHLDRHETMEEYGLAKLQLGKCLKSQQPFFIHCCLEPMAKKLIIDFPFSLFGGAEDQEKIATFLPLGYRKLPKHERENVLAAWYLVSKFGVSQEQFIQALSTFKKPPHRLEFVASIDGVKYYNDSKGTNIEAVISAVEAMQGDVILIAGGVDKGGSYRPWLKAFKGRVKRVLTIGEAASKMNAELGEGLEVEEVDTMESAVKRAKHLAKYQENVLLSPGCASFDQFRDYRHRGEVFKQLVFILGERRRNQ